MIYLSTIYCNTYNDTSPWKCWKLLQSSYLEYFVNSNELAYLRSEKMLKEACLDSQRFRWNKILHVENNLVPFCPFSVYKPNLTYKQHNISYLTVSPWSIIYCTISENGWREKKCVSHNWVAINLASRRTHFTQIVSTGMCGA